MQLNKSVNDHLFLKINIIILTLLAVLETIIDTEYMYFEMYFEMKCMYFETSYKPNMQEGGSKLGTPQVCTGMYFNNVDLIHSI